MIPSLGGRRFFGLGAGSRGLVEDVMAADKVLVYRLGSLGDTIMALPAFHQVRLAFPEADVTLLTNRPVGAKAAPVAAVLGDDGYFFNRTLEYPLGTRDPLLLAAMVLRMRRDRIRTVVNLAAFRSFGATTRDRWFFRLAGAKRLIGFRLGPQDGEPAADGDDGEVEWEAARLARRVAELGVIRLKEDRWWDLRLTRAELAAGESLLLALRRDSPFLCLSVGTKAQAKDWGEDNWKGLLDRLSDKLAGWSVVFLGVDGERDVSERCAGVWRGPYLNLCGRASPRVSAGILGRARAFVGHDSGPMHLAACVGTQCVAVFSARNLPRQWFPRGEHHRVLYNRTDCAGCKLDECVSERKRCILGIDVDTVSRAVLAATGLNSQP